VKKFLFKNRDGQTPVSSEYQKDLKIRTIQTLGELDEYEEQNIALGLSWIISTTRPWNDYLFWMDLHRELFKDVWKWAGKWRLIDLANPDFEIPSQIQHSVRLLEHDLNFWMKDESISAKEKVARFHARFIAIHPFTNGNGRTGRILADHFAKKLGLPPTSWGQSLSKDPSARREAYITALKLASRDGNFEKLIQFIFD
jgi:Fic-DOC domain mobile mystery protein B